MDVQQHIDEITAKAVAAARSLANASTDAKNRALRLAADGLISAADALMAANAKDIHAAQGLSAAMIDRLTLTDSRIRSMADGLRVVADLPDPVGEVFETVERPNGLVIQRVRVPIGVILIIYESRPNVTADAAGLCLKAGNAVILRGGKESLQSNLAIAAVLADAADRFDRVRRSADAVRARALAGALLGLPVDAPALRHGQRRVDAQPVGRLAQSQSATAQRDRRHRVIAVIGPPNIGH